MPKRNKNKSPQTTALDKNAGDKQYHDAPKSNRENPSSDLAQQFSSQVKPAKKKESESLEGFVEAYFSGKIKSLSIDRVRKLKKQIFESERREQLVVLAAKNDLSLDKSRHLLSFVAEISTYQTFQHSMSDFIRDAVMQHPIMVQRKAELWFPMAGSTDPANLIDLFKEIGAGIKTKPEHKPKETRKSDADKRVTTQLKKARLNAFYIASVWRYNKNISSFAELLRVLRATVYKLEMGKSDIEKHMLNYLVTAQDKEQAGVASLMQWYSNQGEYDRNLAAIAQHRVDSLSDELAEKNALLDLDRSEIDGVNEQMNSLREQLNATHENARVQEIHMLADQHAQKGRILRILEEEMPILADCLKALEREPPKVGVAKEYIGTALEKLNKELNQLRGDDNV